MHQVHEKSGRFLVLDYVSAWFGIILRTGTILCTRFHVHVPPARHVVKGGMTGESDGTHDADSMVSIGTLHWTGSQLKRKRNVSRKDEREDERDEGDRGKGGR